MNNQKWAKFLQIHTWILFICIKNDQTTAKFNFQFWLINHLDLAEVSKDRNVLKIAYFYISSSPVYLSELILSLRSYQNISMVLLSRCILITASPALTHTVTVFSALPTYRLLITSSSAIPISLSICHNLFRAPNSWAIY